MPLQNDSDTTVTETNYQMQSTITTAEQSKPESSEILCTPAIVSVCQTSSSIWTADPSVSIHPSSSGGMKMECTDTTSTTSAMGVVTGVLAVLLVVMLAGNVFIYWNIKKRGERRISLKWRTR